MFDTMILQSSIATVNKTQLVVDRLIEYLKSEEIQVGEVIPNEMTLVANLGVSRPIIREALSHLKLLGLIEARKKRGMILTAPQLEPTLEKLLLPKLHVPETRRDIFELRLMLEMGISESLIEHTTIEDIQILENLVKPEKALFSKKRTKSVVRRLVDIDVAFHSKLYAITGNSILQSLQKVLLPTIEFVVAHQFDMDPLSYGKVSHHELIQTIKTRDSSKFRSSMKQHLAVHFNQLYKINEQASI